MNYTDLSDADLLALRAKTKQDVSIEHINQHARKILINALYGSVGNRFFRYYSLDNAKAVTMGGQLATRWAQRELNSYLNRLFKTDTDYVIYGDTDSVIGSTIIKVNGENTSIENYYNDLPENFIKNDVIGHDYVKYGEGESLSVNQSLDVESKPIKYCMKHKVKKRMFKIICDGDAVTVTEDHSVMVLRCGKLIDCKPTEIKKTDKILKL